MLSLSVLQERIGYRFQDEKLLRRAVTHRSYAAEHNERLEFLGDSVLNCVIGYALFLRDTHFSEGDLSRVRANLVCEKTLHEVAKRIDISSFLYMGEGELKTGGAERASILADAMEAIFGAVFREAGFETYAWTFRAGEASKTPAVLLELLNHLASLRLTRSDSIVALGGGVTGDLVGLAASLYLRGIAFVQVPTSLLAMVDSSVGGKTAVNLPCGKNLMGAFHQPVLVVCDPACLDTLPESEMACGWAEIIKYAVLRADPLLPMLEADITDAALEEIISTCVAIKRDIVSEDEFEAGSRALLNLGHTVGHAVERVTDYGVTHGRAVGIGMAVIFRGCVRAGLCDPQALPVLEHLLEKFGLTGLCPYDAEALLEAARSDKKSAGSTITLILPEAFGRCRTERTSFEKLRDLIHLGLNP